MYYNSLLYRKELKMQWKPIDIEDKEIINSFFSANHILASDFTFTNLYLWHYSRHISYIILNECLVIKTQYPNQNPFIFYPFHKNNNKEAKKTNYFRYYGNLQGKRYGIFHTLFKLC